MRKCTQKEDVNVYSKGSQIMYTNNDEFRIDTDKDCYARLHNYYGYNLPSETSMQKVDDCLYYAGGNDLNFKIIDFEVYGVE